MATKAFFSPSGLAQRLDLLRARPRLIALDYDGTLSRLAATPQQAVTPKGTMHMLRALVSQKGTTVAVISGRPLEDLRARLPEPRLILVGNHGLACSHGAIGIGLRNTGPYERKARRLAAALLTPAAAVPGCLVEYKGLDLSVHYRQAGASRARNLLALARKLAGAQGFIARQGKMVLELRPDLPANKGVALNKLAKKLARGWERHGCLIWAGDDATDEDAFTAAKDLGPRALAVKVGLGRTAAPWRVRGPEELALLLSII